MVTKVVLKGVSYLNCVCVAALALGKTMRVRMRGILFTEITIMCSAIYEETHT